MPGFKFCPRKSAGSALSGKRIAPTSCPGWSGYLIRRLLLKLGLSGMSLASHTSQMTPLAPLTRYPAPSRAAVTSAERPAGASLRTSTFSSAARVGAGANRAATQTTIAQTRRDFMKTPAMRLAGFRRTGGSQAGHGPYGEVGRRARDRGTPLDILGSATAKNHWKSPIGAAR